MAEQKKVLIIDDDMDFREMVKVVLESENYQVIEAADGKTGLDLINTAHPDFIFLDVMMEEVDSGCKLADEIARLNIKIPVVIISSFANAARQTFDISSIPVKEYLQKPLNSDELLAIVKRYA